MKIWHCNTTCKEGRYQLRGRIRKYLLFLKQVHVVGMAYDREKKRKLEISHFSIFILCRLLTPDFKRLRKGKCLTSKFTGNLPGRTSILWVLLVPCAKNNSSKTCGW